MLIPKNEQRFIVAEMLNLKGYDKCDKCCLIPKCFGCEDDVMCSHTAAKEMDVVHKYFGWKD